MRIIRRLAVLGAGLIAAQAAFAADPIDLVGTWKATGEAHASIRLGDDNAHHPEYDTPSVGAPADAWTIVIKEQQGRAFHGVAQSPKGGEEEIVGVLSFDGEHMLIAGDEAGLFGEVLGDKIEFCYQDHEEGRASVACFIAAKQ
ncbi:MAG TPA: hypothetical protein VFK86_02775 [Bauldia sp.]|nr:hypothetical protein [Bauldia sp.]